jgi:putative transposase
MLEPRRKPLRLAGHDYSRPGAYFITLVTIDRQCVFGEVVESSVRLSRTGEIIAATWRDIPAHYAKVTLDEFVVMPNHLHGVLIFDSDNRHPLPAVIGAFKRLSARTAGLPVWQRSYHDRVVRGEEELARIREYVANNPAQWAMDEENPERRMR